MVQLSHPYMTTGKTIALTLWTFVRKVMSLLFNMLSRCVNSFLSEEQVSFNFMAIIAVCSDLGAQRQYSSMLMIVLFGWEDYFILSLCSFHIV